ncbi:MAG: PAS domain S-box protein [Nitrospirae bacterium]|nr:PAS domain S-box protein [Nitrospirota bacterium]
MNKLFSMSIRSQLFSIVFILAFFAAGIIVYSSISFRNEKINEAFKDSSMLADSVANEHEKMVADARQLMLTLAQLSEVKTYNSAGMQQVLKEVLSANPKYSNIFITDRAGRVLASAVTARDSNVSVSDRRYFINALATGRFSSGEYMISRFTGKPVLSFGYPFKDRRGGILGVIVTGIDLTYYKTLLDTLQLPSGSSYLLLDHKGTIMTRGINPTDFIGQQYDPAGFKRMVDGPDKNTFVAVAHDGIKRYISYRKIRLDGEQTPYMYIRSGIPVAMVLSGANKVLMRDLILLTASLCIVVVLAWIIAKHSIIDRLALLEMASKRLADGDLNVKVSDLVAGGELSRLALTFDHMARQIGLREESLEQKTLEQNAILENALVGIAFLKDRRFVWINSKMEQMFGYPMSEISGLTTEMFYPSHESYEQLGSEAYPVLAAGGTYYCERKMKRKDGSLFWCSISGKTIDPSVLSKGAIWVLEDITERKQAESELRLHSEILANMAEGVFLIRTRDERIVYANKKLEYMLGYDSGELVGKHVSIVNAPCEKSPEERAEETIQGLNANGVWQGEVQNIRKNETIFWCNVNVSTYEHPQYGSVWISIHQDITERKLMEMALQQSEEKFRTLFESAIDALFIIDMDGNFIDVNKTAYERLGYTKEEMLSMKLSQLDQPEFAARLQERMEHMQNKGEGVFESAHLRKDGTAMPVEINTRVMEFQGKKVFFSVIRDISERKQMEEALHESEKRYRTLFEQSPDGMLLIDTAGKIIKFNETAHQQLGYTREEFEKLSLSDIDPVESPEQIQDRINRLLKEGKVEFDVKHRTKQGEIRDVQIITQPIDLSGKTFFHTIWFDITERKKAEQQIKQSLKEKEILLREIHHRVKNNLAVISSLLRLQALGAKNESLSEALEESQQRIKSMALVHEHLYQARDFSCINYKDFINDIVKELETIHLKRNRTIVTKLNIEDLTLDIDSAIPCSLIINELITNTYKYAFPDSRSGELSISFVKEADTYILAIKDNGIGLPEGFDYRKSNTLGLQIVNVLCKQLRGTLQMRSDRGTEAVITFKPKGNQFGKEKNTDS